MSIPIAIWMRSSPNNAVEATGFAFGSPPTLEQQKESDMMMQCKGFIAGFITATVLVVILGFWYGSWRQKLGTLQGRKQGKIEVAEFLEQHFPTAEETADVSGPTYNLKWYSITVVESNGVATLRVKKMM